MKILRSKKKRKVTQIPTKALLTWKFVYKSFFLIKKKIYDIRKFSLDVRKFWIFIDNFLKSKENLF